MSLKGVRWLSRGLKERRAAQGSRRASRWRARRRDGDAIKVKKCEEVLAAQGEYPPLQRILSALHLFQDVVFPLRRDSPTPPFRSKASSRLLPSRLHFSFPPLLFSASIHLMPAIPRYVLRHHLSSPRPCSALLEREQPFTYAVQRR